jgi:hypothetical protein
MATSSNLLDVISSAVTEFVGKSKQVEADTTKTLEAAKQLSAEQVQILNQVSVDQGAIIRQQQIAELEAQNQRRANVIAINSDPSTSGGLINQLLTTIGTKVKSTQETLQKYNKEQSTEFLSDPIGWIKAGFDWDGTKEKLQAEVGDLKTAEAGLQTVNNAIQQTARTTETTKELVTKATIDLAVNIAASESQLKAKAVAIEGLRFNLAQSKAVIDGSSERLTALYNQNAAVNQEENQKIALANLAISQSREARDATQTLVMNEARAAGKRVDDVTLGYINTSRASQGLPPLGADEFQAQKQLGATKDLGYHLQNGQRIAITGQSMVGASPAESAEFLVSMPHNFAAGRKEVAALIVSAYDALGKEKNPSLADTKENQGARATYVNAKVSEELARQSQSITPDVSNLRHLGDLSSYIGSAESPGIRSLQSLPITQKLLAPAIGAKANLSDPKIVLGMTTDAIRKGVVTSDEAIKGLSEVYRRANELHLAHRGFIGFGIVLPAAGKNYQIQGGPNMTDPVSLGRYFSKSLANQAYVEMATSRSEATGRTQGYTFKGPANSSGLNLPADPAAYLRGGPDISYTPENYREGVRRVQEGMK